MSQLYDVYLFPVARTTRPIALEPALEASLRDLPAWLGISRTWQECRAVYGTFYRAGYRGWIAECEYREPAISPEEGLAIAEGALETIRNYFVNEEGFDPRFSALEIDRSPENCIKAWVFAARSQELQDRGYIPGVEYVYVDKLSGRIIEEAELYELRQVTDRLLDPMLIEESVQILIKEITALQERRFDDYPVWASRRIVECQFFITEDDDDPDFQVFRDIAREAQQITGRTIWNFPAARRITKKYSSELAESCRRLLERFEDPSTIG